MFESTDFTVFDLETTGLDPNLGHKIVEIGAIRVSSRGHKSVFETLVNPRRPIPAQATAIHNITDDMVRNSPPIQEVLPIFLDFCNDSIIVAHNARFDLKFLSFAMNELSIQPLNATILDSVKLARKFFPNLESYSLPSLRRVFDLDTSQEHRALSDVKATLEIFQKCLEKAREEGISDVMGLEEAQGGPISFRLQQAKPEPILPYKLLRALLKAMDSGEKVKIVYQDVDGSKSERFVTPRRFIRFGLHVYMVAFCHLQHGDKTFRLDKILMPE